ncbi:MAG: hypothetical protein ABII72_01270 [Parcubacteria group bacterium]
MEQKDRQTIYAACGCCGFLFVITIIAAAVFIFGWKVDLNQFVNFNSNSANKYNTGKSMEQRDSQRESDIRQIGLAMELVFDDDAKYLTSIEMPTKIASGDYTHLENVPQDPLGKSYLWKDNTADPQNYCVAAELEGTSGYFICNQDYCQQEANKCE